MNITDLEGRNIEITDLQKAIEQADNFRHLKHTSNEMEMLNRELNEYWNDVYNKLCKLNNIN